MQNWRRPKLSIYLWIAAAAWCGVLFFFSGQSGAESGALSLRFTRLLLRFLPGLYPHLLYRIGLKFNSQIGLIP